MAKLGIRNVDKTDLPDACGVSMDPCMAKIGTCALGRLIPSSNGQLTPQVSTCACFVRGFQEPIPLEGSSDRVISCSVNCVDAILKFVDSHVVASNGPGADKDLMHLCKDSLDVVAHNEFGNKNDYISSDSDTGGMSIMPVDDPRVKRAAEAVGVFINNRRTADCPVMTNVDADTVEVAYAKRGIVEDGKGQYKLETRFGRQVFFARISHLPKDEQLVNPANTEDPENLEGRFEVLSVTPEPCDSAEGAQLAVSDTAVQAINAQRLPWTAQLHAAHEGLPRSAFGMGYKPLPEKERAAYVTQLDVTGFTPPAAYDARDTPAGQRPAKAFKALNQGSCGSCYAFASAVAFSSRLQRYNPGPLGDIVASPQELMDCTNGCDGGDPLAVFTKLLQQPAVDFWCDPYTGAKSTCGGVCSNGNPYLAQAGSMRTVGAGASDVVVQMQLELLRGGPGVVSMTVYSDFSAYKSGVYVVSSGATPTGAHAVVLLGWGDEGGVPYWLIQNSWGESWGIQGFAKIRRGTNEAGLEKNGITVVKAVPPAFCPASACKNGAEVLKDCSCRCLGKFSGPDCGTCPITCQNGGRRDDAACACTCPLGFFGPSCEAGYKVTPTVACLGGADVKVDYAFGGDILPPPQNSFIAIYPAAQTTTLDPQPPNLALLCGDGYNKALNNGLCPATGSVNIQLPATPGAYKVAVVAFIPPTDKNPQSGYLLELKPANIVAQFTLIDAACAPAAVQAAEAQNDPAALLDASLAAAAKAQQNQQDLMTDRLAKAQDIIAQLQAELPPSVDIAGLNSNKPVVWMTGPPFQVCYRVKASMNLNPKALVLYAGGADSNSFYSTGLNGAGASKPLPADYQGCVTVNLASGLPAGPYTIKLVDLTRAPVQTMIAAASFSTASASVRFSSYSLSGTSLTLTALWTVDEAQASVTDTVRVLNSQGTTVYWFFTSCKCQDTAGATAVKSGAQTFTLYKTNSVPGGYALQFLPGGGPMVAAVANNWIDWVKIGW